MHQRNFHALSFLAYFQSSLFDIFTESAQYEQAVFFYPKQTHILKYRKWGFKQQHTTTTKAAAIAAAATPTTKLSSATATTTISRRKIFHTRYFEWASVHVYACAFYSIFQRNCQTSLVHRLHTQANIHQPLDCRNGLF